MVPGPEQVLAGGRSLLRLIAVVDAVHRQHARDPLQTYSDQARERVQAIVDRNQGIIDAW